VGHRKSKVFSCGIKGMQTFHLESDIDGKEQVFSREKLDFKVCVGIGCKVYSEF
jgi:hypothetical protein